VLDIFVNLLLQLPELLQRTFGEHAEVTRVLSQNFVTIGFKDALHASHLLYGLVKLFGCPNHNFIPSILSGELAGQRPYVKYLVSVQVLK